LEVVAARGGQAIAYVRAQGLEKSLDERFLREVEKLGVEGVGGEVETGGVKAKRERFGVE